MRFTTAILSLGLTRLAHTSAFAPTAIINAASRRSSSSLNGVLTDLVVGIDAPRITKVPAAAFSTAASSSSPPPTTMPDITETEVRALFELWNQALATGDSRIVADRYIKEPMLLPTVSDQPRTDFDSVKDYFDAFLLKKPQGKILEGKIYIGDGWASDTGIYEFTMGTTGDKVKARYSYNYVQEDGQWKIQHHHSSVMPEEIALGKSITEDGVRELFSLWNNALSTLDPKKVAARYAKNGVLLPTVSDVPRTDFTSIEDYFINFLKNKREYYVSTL